MPAAHLAPAPAAPPPAPGTWLAGPLGSHDRASCRRSPAAPA